MNIIIKKKYTLITSEETSFERFIENFEKEFEQFKENHIIVEISSKNNFTEQNILVLLKYVISHQQNGLSFVVISKNVDVDHFPDTFNIVPTLIEAEDVIELENIQRSLGF